MAHRLIYINHQKILLLLLLFLLLLQPFHGSGRVQASGEHQEMRTFLHLRLVIRNLSELLLLCFIRNDVNMEGLHAKGRRRQS